MTAAEATTKVIPMMASWGTTVPLRRLNEKIRAPRSVKPSEKASDRGVPCSTPIIKPTVVPKAAIWANAQVDEDHGPGR